MFEIVYTLTDWYDGPRQGIAAFHGTPHLYVSDWETEAGFDLDADTFLLMPIDSATFALALEDWAIWRRWETAFHGGRTPHETHPALPEERDRHLELERELEKRLVLDAARAVRKRGEFRVRHDRDWSGHGFRPLKVRWHDAE